MDGVTLGVEQEAVVAADPGAKVLVLAGPGTGKTHTLLARVARLLSTAPEDGGSVLILSFTRAVVRELHERLRATGITGLEYLRPLTFDSFASRLLRGVPELAGWDAWETGGYQERIEAATSALRSVPEASEWLGRFDHVVVDEIQDLVGSRAAMVLEVLSRVPAFDLFGDPAQGIYGWQLEGERDPSADLFLERVRLEFEEQIAEFELTENHRMSDEQALRCAASRPGLIDLRGAARALPEMRRLLQGLETVGELHSLAAVLRTGPRRTAILARTNVETMLISEALYAAGVDHALRRGAAERVVPGWLAGVCAKRRSSLDCDTFVARYEELGVVERDPLEAWELLGRIEGDGDRLDIGSLAAAVRSGTVPDELCTHGDAPVVVSTIHRAKGLEFDMVIIVQPEDWRVELADQGEEARVLFVAMTRARDGLFHMDSIDTSGWRSDRNCGRWIFSYPGQTWMTKGFEIKGTDIHHMHPGGTWMFDANPIDLQKYLGSEVRTGDEAWLDLVQGWDDDEQMARYVLHHGERPVGVTGEGFARSLSVRLAGWGKVPKKWPPRIAGLRIEGVDTVAGLEGVGEDAGLGRSGLWLRPRPVGLGEVMWS